MALRTRTLRSRSLVLSCAALALLAPELASADTAGAPAPPAAPRAWHVDLAAGTQFPISIGAVATAEVPYRLLFQLDVGWLPQPYGYVINDFLKAIGSYDDTVAALIRTALGNSLVLRASAGWRPFPNHGFEALAGYTLVALGGSLSGADVVQTWLREKGSDVTLPPDAKEVGIHAALHSFQISLGWRWLLLDDRLVLRASVSYLQCVAAKSSLDLPPAPRPGPGASMVEAKINQEFDRYLSPYFTTYVKTPVLGVSLGYRF
jgi:hypothetical protein